MIKSSETHGFGLLIATLAYPFIPHVNPHLKEIENYKFLKHKDFLLMTYELRIHQYSVPFSIPEKYLECFILYK